MDRQFPLREGRLRFCADSAGSCYARSSQHPMRVAFYASAQSLRNPGGGEVQLKKTAEYLRRQGTEVQVISGPTMWSEFDWLHIFGTVREGLALARAAKQHGVSVAL